jgi:hypothetical protein
VGDDLAMSGKEREKLVEMELVAEGREKLVEAARRLAMSYRQVKRVWRRYREEGAGGLVHRGRGRGSNRSKGEEVRERCVEAYRGRLVGFGPTLAAEKLAEWGVAEVGHETLRRWLVAEGLWRRQRKRGRHRRWREPKAQFGELVQVDGSHHDWFGRGERCCLMNMVDDATGVSLARMAEEETAEAAMRVLGMWIARYGVPRALYADRKNIYVNEREPTVEEQLAGEVPLTPFGKACARLGIRIIPASSPQARGRVERKHGVYQDRLAKELQLGGITTIAGANELLEGGFVEQLNGKFARPAAQPEDAHRPLPKEVDLATVFVFEQTRTVPNDWVIRHENRFWQLTGPTAWLPRPKTKVVVQQRLDGALHILYRGRELTFREVPVQSRRMPSAKSLQALDRPPRHSAPSPAPDHPWRRPFSRRLATAQKDAESRPA